VKTTATSPPPGADQATHAHPDQLVVVSIKVADRDTAHALAGALQNLIEPAPDALSLFEIRDPGSSSPSGPLGGFPSGWQIDAYFDAPPSADTLSVDLASIVGCAPPHIDVAQVPDENWVAISQDALPPVRAGGFTIHGSHDRHRVGLSPHAIEIDAGEAFGTAHHATTYGCLEAIGELTRKFRFYNVLDLGCGSGVLAIAVRRRQPGARILATDIDAHSCHVARANLRINRLTRRIAIATATGLAHPEILQRAPFDLIIANILAAPLIELAPDIARYMRSGGTLVLSGLLVTQSRQIIATYRAAGFQVVSHRRIAEWSTLTLNRRALIR